MTKIKSRKELEDRIKEAFINIKKLSEMCGVTNDELISLLLELARKDIEELDK